MTRLTPTSSSFPAGWWGPGRFGAGTWRGTSRFPAAFTFGSRRSSGMPLVSRVRLVGRGGLPLGVLTCVRERIGGRRAACAKGFCGLSFCGYPCTQVCTYDTCRRERIGGCRAACAKRVAACIVVIVFLRWTTTGVQESAGGGDSWRVRAHLPLNGFACCKSLAIIDI